MKYILSLFFLLFSLSLQPLLSRPASALSGTPPLSFGTVLYVPEYAESTFFLKWQPFSCFSLYAGNLSFEGLWTLFSSPTPVSGNALKQKKTEKSAFRIQGKDTGLFPLYCAAETVFQGGKFIAFAGCEKKHSEYRLQTGAGISFPFTIKKAVQDKKEKASGYWALAWKRTYVEAPKSSSRLMQQQTFKSFYVQSFIQAFMITAENIRFSAENGWAENPYGSPAFFINANIFQSTDIFLYNAGLFLCSKNYLKHNGLFEKKRIQALFNPQLKFALPYRHFEAIRFGVEADIFYEKEWILKSRAALRVQGILYSFNTDIRLPPLVFHNENQKARSVFKKKADTVLKSALEFSPPYTNSFKSKWTIGGHCTFNAGTQRSKTIKNYGVKAGFKGVLEIKNSVRCTASVAANTEFPAVSTRIKAGIGADFFSKGCKNKFRLSTSAEGECYVKKTSLQKTRGCLTLKIRYN